MSTPSDTTESDPSPEEPAIDEAVSELMRMPIEELQELAQEIGIDPTDYRKPRDLAAAINERREMISAMDREAMIDVLRWGKRPIPPNPTQQQLATQIAQIKSMRFSGLSLRGLIVLAVMRGVELRGDEDESRLTKLLKRQEGFFKKMARKRRAWLGSIVSGMLGEEDARADDQFVAPQPPGTLPDLTPPNAREGSLKDEIEEVGLFGGLASRVKRSADTYVNQKLDEIESRIDRKLDEIDRRLAEWRDKEVANRLRILKVTLWVSIIVAALSLVYTYIQVYFPHR